MNLAILTLSVVAAAAVESARMVNQAGSYPAAGGLAFGATRSAGEIGDPVPVDVMGTAIATAGAAFAKDVAVMVGTDGKVIAHDGAAASIAVGRSMQAAAGDGDQVEILLVPHAGANDTDAIA